LFNNLEGEIMKWLEIAVIVLCTVKTIEFSYRFMKWIKK